MPKKSVPLQCSKDDKMKIITLCNSRTDEHRLVQRAKIIAKLLEGVSIVNIARLFSVRPNTVIDCRRRFEREGLLGLFDRPRSGKPPRYSKEFRNQILALLETPPPKGQATWDGKSLASCLQASDDAVWRVLRKEGISLARQRSWCVSTDPEFTSKAANIIGLYLNPPEDAIVISIDEKPSIQALERAYGYVYTSSGKIVRGFKSTYKRHGTLNLFAALKVATGEVKGKITTQKRRVEFLEFMDEVVVDLPATTEVHVIMDNYCIHKNNDLWLTAHPQVHFHFTPTSASWLNMVEIWFGIFTRKALRGASFSSAEDLRRAIEDYISVYTLNVKPFIWRKREVKGSQLKNNIVNLCN